MTTIQATEVAKSSDGHHRHRPGYGDGSDHSTAIQLVQNILEQITTNDAPAVNELSSSSSSPLAWNRNKAVVALQFPVAGMERQASTSPSQSVTADCLLVNSTSSLETMEASTDNNNNNNLNTASHSNSIFFSTFQRQDDPTWKMGHDALAELCCTSLARFGPVETTYGNCSSSNVIAPSITPLSNTINAKHEDSPVLPMDDKTEENSKAASTTDDSALAAMQQKQHDLHPLVVESFSSRRLRRRRHSKFFRLARKPRDLDGYYANMPECDDDDATQEEKKQDDLKALIRKPRLQQFGSEYARFLSNSQLAAPQARLVVKQQQQTASSGIMSSRRPPIHSSSRTAAMRLLEDAPIEIQTGALLDICVTAATDDPPPGYYRVSRTTTNITAKSSVCGAGLPLILTGNYHLCVKKEPVWDKAAQRPTVTALALIFPDRQEFVPPGFSTVRLVGHSSSNKNTTTTNNNNSSVPANLGDGTERVYLCFRRSREGNPITGLLALVPPDAVPVGYTVLEHTPRHHVARLCLANHKGTTATYHGSNKKEARSPVVFLAYRQRLANLETLRPPPLVQTLLDQQQQKEVVTAGTDRTGKKSNRRRVTLGSYYATGGTTVASDIGRFHILDRTTHSLLSPSSIANRLSLIELSRQPRSSSDTNGCRYSMTTYARSDVSDTVSHASNGSIHGSVRSSAISRHPNKNLWLTEIHEQQTMEESERLSQSQQSGGYDNARAANLSSLLTPAKSPPSQQDEMDGNTNKSVTNSLDPVVGPIGGKDDVEHMERLEALSFIPEVETAIPQSNTSMRRLDDRVALITPILTACYTRHGGAALVAVEGLTKLLTETSFFHDDTGRYFHDEELNESSTRLTLLDLAIQSVCDVATSGAHDRTFPSCVEFVEGAVRLAQGKLHTRTVGFVVRFYLFVFYFDASIPMHQATPIWPAKAWRPVDMADEPDFPMLHDPRESSEFCGNYLPGGAPQTAALALKELISLSIERLGKVSVTEMLSQPSPRSVAPSSNNEDMYAPLLEGILSTVVDNAVDHVERANYTQLALHQIHRSGGSELFWHDMVHECGSGLFAKDTQLGEAGKDIYIMIFAMLQQIVKVASGKLRSGEDANVLLPKDLASKLLSLELLLHFLESWSDEQEAVQGWAEIGGTEATRSIETLSFVVRRTVVPCLLGNTPAVVSNPQVFRRVIRIVSELWCSPVYRRHCKVELGILVEHFGLRILEMGPQCRCLHDKHCLLAQQVELLAEIKNWFLNDPKEVIEMYLNYDTDISSEITGVCQMLPGTRWQIFQRLCGGLSNVAEQCGELIGDQIRQNQALISTQDINNADSVESRLLAEKKSTVDISTDREAARVLRRSSVETMAQIVKAIAISSGASCGKEFMDLLLSWCPVETPIAYEKTFAHLFDEAASPKTGVCETDADIKKGVLNFWRKLITTEQRERFSPSNPSRDESLDVAFEIGQQKSLKKAIEYLIACNMLTPSPRDIANFLRIYKDRLDPTDLGLYLSETGIIGAEIEYWKSIRYLFVRPISFIGMTVDEGLRHFLTASGFRLPGEAQRIDRVVETFSQCFFEDNAGDMQRCPFKDQDTVFLLVFAIIMLNTDLHKSDPKSKKSSKKMTKAEFANNLKGATVNEALCKDYLYDIYDSILAKPIAMHDEAGSAVGATQSDRIEEMRKSVRGSDSLLRGLAVHDFHFATIDDFTNALAYTAKDALSDLTCSCVSKTWYHWHGVINTCLETAHLDPQGMEPAIDILLYALVVTTCLQMPVERNAFVSQLVRFRTFEERRQGRWLSAADQSHREEQWYLELDQACSGPPAAKLQALQGIYNLIQTLKNALRVDARSKVEMTAAVGELVNGDFLLLDPSRSFLKSDDLVKKSSRTGRATEYRFYLFSDVLIYASREDDGRYKIHEELPLHLMKITDWFPPAQKNRQSMFEVHHPRKSFRVLCPSSDIRKAWVEQIRASILMELEHKMMMENARLSEVVARGTSLAA